LAANAETVTGTAAPMDGDTFEVDGVIFRLADIDAPELAQKCPGGPKDLRNCGAYVADALADCIRGQTVSCEIIDVDDYDRRIARCEHENSDLSVWLIERGLAMAYRKFSDRLGEQEDQARSYGAGLWQTSFEPPWEYRAKRWEVAVQDAPDGCPIKGNINRDEVRIYHTPWGSQWYERTKISLDQGERWFCSEREALDAGWRAPLR
jgi:endonuclease YncB( thermonuclease family)